MKILKNHNVRTKKKIKKMNMPRYIEIYIKKNDIWNAPDFYSTL